MVVSPNISEEWDYSQVDQALAIEECGPRLRLSAWSPNRLNVTAGGSGGTAGGGMADPRELCGSSRRGFGFVLCGDNYVPVALVPTNGGSIPMKNPKVTQVDLQKASSFFQKITEVRQFGRGGILCCSADQDYVRELLHCSEFAAQPVPAAGHYLQTFGPQFALLKRARVGTTCTGHKEMAPRVAQWRRAWSTCALRKGEPARCPGETPWLPRLTETVPRSGRLLLPTMMVAA
ncbi:uncharacterized protein LOC142802696 [Rhipicephalus microplus]|uniref:uncharacterized protein LOC142802696 n=1 Tax=Rhipicephalus microplus TaxID=6941 RepID=UPI003F6D385A